ncbi:MAG: thioredoxin domain-containing protein [Candidatus Marinimicrobia bacterium]|nr:thioredoxin domain-containing protein [Candidatus Neomarinimicrobiota bacterium]
MIKNNQNRLINSDSPYLLQHASNPVDWYPWSEEAFYEAKNKNKPIFLSIGYSTCHWCHVMEHESFEDSSVAQLMNESFVNIKVDREEMPEIDHLYMSVCQAMTGQGGWPLTIVMTPDKEPFFSGTYFPKNGRGNRPGMLQLIPAINNAWKNKQNEIQNTINQINDYLIKTNSGIIQEKWDEEIINEAYSAYNKMFDDKNGGFGSSPKFPSPHNLMFLIKFGKNYMNTDALKMALKTLDKIRNGGIFDHIGYGFHRYSTDEKWLVPHFEKMLYDQAMLSIAYLEAYQVTKKNKYAKVAEEIFTYVLRDMTDKNGGFYSAEDADSEGEEGKFYTWSTNQFLDVLGEKDGEIMKMLYNFDEKGNFLDEVTHKTNGFNIPHLSNSINNLSSEIRIPVAELEKIIEKNRKILFHHRKKRIHPLKDDKILTDWNGLMIAALAYGGSVLNNINYTNAAENSAKFILENLKDNKGRLLKRYRNGSAKFAPHIDDYSFLVWGLLNLYEATYKSEYLREAIELSDIMVKDFGDNNGGGFFIGANYSEKLIIRAKESYDGAIPSGNSVAVMNLNRISHFTGNTIWSELADKTLRAFTESSKKTPTGFSHMISAYMSTINKSKEIVVVGEDNQNETKDILKKIHSLYIPNRVIIFKNINKKNNIEKIASWTKPYSMLDSLTTIYVCENFSCKLPTNDWEVAKSYLED